jgi:ABC-type uncharacterized transport system permease subunit
MITTISILAIIAYFIAWSLVFIRCRAQLSQSPHISSTYLKLAWGIGISLHATVLYLPLLENANLSLGLTSAISHVFWLISLLIFYTTYNWKIETLGLFIIPLAMISIVVMTLFSPKIGNVDLSGGLGVHILTSLLAYSLLLFATIQAVLTAYQNKNLHKHVTGGLTSTLPALQDMEALLFRLIKFGVTLLTIALLSGFSYLDGFFDKEIAHKTLFSLLSWITFSSLLYGHLRHGWRGRIAVRWTLFGSTFLLLAYFGSKFVFEYLLS